jgi:hypothetical protein
LLPVIVIVMVAAGDAADPTSVAMMQTTKRALDPDATVLSIETQTIPTDASAESIARAQHADAIVIVSWSSDHEHARVRVRSASGEWSEREIQFAAADAPPERGRALGLVAATMVPGVTTPPPSPPPVVPPVPPATPMRRFIVGVGGVFAGGLDTAAVSGGPVVLGSARIAWWIWVHLAADLRFGRFDLAKANAIWISIAPGAGLRAPVGRDVWFGLRSHFAVLGTQLSSAQASGGRASVGNITMLEAGWQPGRFGASLGAGLEIPFEHTAVISGGVPVGYLPTWRLRAELAVTVAF